MIRINSDYYLHRGYSIYQEEFSDGQRAWSVYHKREFLFAVSFGELSSIPEILEGYPNV